MEFDLIKLRENVMDRADQALDAAWPKRKGDDYVREMRWAAGELEKIASEMQSSSINQIEQSRTYRYLGSVLSDLAPALGKEMLFKAKEAYEKAEVLLQGVADELEMAKLNFNFANILRQIDPNNLQLLNEAMIRLHAARKCFAMQAPQLLSQVDEALISVENLLKIAPLAIDVEQKIKSMQKLQDELQHGGELSKIATEAQELINRDGGVAGTILRIEALIASLNVRETSSEKLGEIRKQMEAVSTSVLKGKPLTGNERKMWVALEERLQSEKLKGTITGDHAETINRIMEQFGDIYSGGEDDLSSLLNKTSKMREFIISQFELNHYLSHGIGRPPEGSRAAKLVELNWQLRRYLLEEMSRMDKGEDESKEVLELNVRASKVDRRIYEAGSDDERALNILKEELLPLAQAVRFFSARFYSMSAQPVWHSAKVPVDVREILYSGPTKLKSFVSNICSKLGLELMPEPKGEGYAAARWKQLQKSISAIFDLRVEERSEIASVAYEMGIALTLGKPIIVITEENETLPFDVDVIPIILAVGSKDESDLSLAIDKSLVWTYLRPRANASLNTLENVINKNPRPNPDVYADQTLRMLSELRKKPDSLAITRTLTKFYEYLKDGKTMLVQPVWSPVYPSGEEARLFHVMPFRPQWADSVKSVTREACEDSKVKYIRGDEIAEPNVIHSIWEEIAKATHVFVDLTDLNANVALELGIAHTLGKNVLMVCQRDPKEHVFQSISKFRVHSYDIKNLEKTLYMEVKKFLSSK